MAAFARGAKREVQHKCRGLWSSSDLFVVCYSPRAALFIMCGTSTLELFLVDLAHVRSLRAHDDSLASTMRRGPQDS
jgi:hypothetical protein